MTPIEEVNQAIRDAHVGGQIEAQEVSDGFHTFKELYDMRLALCAALWNSWAAQGAYATARSKRHHDGELAFGGGWFIITADTPVGQISFHYEISDWDLFGSTKEYDTAPYPFDGHTTADVINRLKML